MKKSVLVLLSVLLVFSFVLAGCGKKEPKSPYEGTTWSLSGGKDGASGIEITKEQLADQGMTEFVIELKENSVVSVTVTGETHDSTWTEKDGVITLDPDGEPLALTVDGDRLVMDQDGTELYFGKQ